MSRKITTLIWICLLCMLPCLTWAQSLTQYEYWFDDDFGGKVVGSLSGTEAVFNSNISTDQLDNGVHKFSFRAKQSDGKYSAITSSLFLKRPATQGSMMEYWFDDNFNQRDSISISSTEDEQEMTLDLQNNTKYPMGFHKLNMRLKIEGEGMSAVYSADVLKLSAGKATKLEYWIDNDRAHSKTISGKTATGGYLFSTDLDLSGITPGYHLLHCRAVSSSKRTVSAVTTTPIMVKLSSGIKVIQYSLAVDGNSPVTYPIANPANEVEVSHVLDASKELNGEHRLKMFFWNSLYESVADSADFIVNRSGFKLATPIASSFKATDINPNGFTASWKKVEGALYYDILVKKEGGDYEHPDYVGGSSITSTEVTGLNPNTSYYFQIRARNDNRNEASDWSASIPTAVKTAKVPTATANLAIYSIKGFDGSKPLTVNHTHHYHVWVVNNGNSLWNGSFYLKDGDEDIGRWYNISIPSGAAKPLECDYTPETIGTKALVLYYQTGGTGGGIPVDTNENTSNMMTVQVIAEPTFNVDIQLAKAIACPTTVQRGKTESLSATVKNIGNKKWDGTLYLVDNGITLNYKKVTLASGKEERVPASWTPETTGIHEIAVYYKSDNGYNWQLLSENEYSNPVSVLVTKDDALTNATLATITHVSKEVVPREVTAGSVVNYYFRLTDEQGNRLKGIRIRFYCTGSTLRDIVETKPSDDNGIAVLQIQTEGSAAIAKRGQTVKMVCAVLLNENNETVQHVYEQSDGEMELTIHQGNSASIESGFENVEKMKFTLDLGVSAKADLGNYVKAKGSVSFPLSLSLKFGDDGSFTSLSFDAKAKGSLSGSVGDFAEQNAAQDYGTAAIIPQGSVGISGGYHYNFSSNDWKDIFVRFVMHWCDNYWKVSDWKKDLAIKTLENWYSTKRDFSETTNWFIGGEVGASIDFMNIVSLPSFLPRSTKMPLMEFPDLGLGGKVSFNFDCNIKKKSDNLTLNGDGASYKIQGNFKAQEKVRNLYSDVKYWWNTSVRHGFYANQLDNFYKDSPTQNLSRALSMASEELFDDSGNLREVSHEMSLEEGWELSFDRLSIPWNPLDLNEAKINVTSTSSSKFASTGDWATFVGDIATNSPESSDAKHVHNLYPNLNFKTIFVAPGEIFNFWKNPPVGSLEALFAKASNPSQYKLKEALKVEQTLSSDLTMAVNIPFFDWKILKFSIDVGATIGIYNKPSESYYSVEDKCFLPISIHPTTSIYKITGWLTNELAKKFKSLFKEEEVSKYIPMDDAYGVGSVQGFNTILIVPGLPEYDPSVDPTQPNFINNHNEGVENSGMPRQSHSMQSKSLSHYMLDNFDNKYAQYIIQRHPHLGKNVQRDICTFTFSFNKDIQNFDEGVQIKIPHYYPAGDLLGITEEGDTLFVVSEVCNLTAQIGETDLTKTQRGDFEITGNIGVDDLIPFGFPENQPLDVYFCEDGSTTWQYIGPAGVPLKTNKMGAYMMATSIKNDTEAPQVTATLNETTGLMHINVSDNIGIRVSTLQVLVNGELREISMLNEANYELQLNAEDLEYMIVVNISVEDISGNTGTLFQIFNLDKPSNLDIPENEVEKNTEISLNRKQLIVNGAKAGSIVTVYSINGYVQAKTNADSDGHAQLTFNSLQEGIYIVTLSEGKSKKIYVK